MFTSKLPHYCMERIVWKSIISMFFILLVPAAISASANDACFNGCHDSSSTKPINISLYDSNPHSIIECVDCHVNSTSNADTNHGQFIRQLKGSIVKGSGPLLTKYYSENFSLCYYCHAEEKVVGVLPGYKDSPHHRNSNISVPNIGTNFRNENSNGTNSGSDVPTNIHWNHLDDFGSLYNNGGGMYDYDGNGVINGIYDTGPIDSHQSCPACHNVHGTNYPKMTKNDLALKYGSDGNGSFGYIVGGGNYSVPGGDLYCTAGCHSSSGVVYKYYRNEINLSEDCVSCHVDGAPGNVNGTAFSQGVHVNIRIGGNGVGNGAVNNSSCWTCHYNKDMNRSKIWQCSDCHTGNGLPSVPTAPKIRTHESGVPFAKITNYSCVDCHSKVIVDPGTGIPNITSHYLKRPTISSVNYCDYCHGPNASSPFPATNKTIPAFSHDDPSWGGNATCRTCHTNSTAMADPLANDTSSFHDLTTELGDVYNGTKKADCFICHVLRPLGKLGPEFVEFVAAPSPPHDITGLNVEDCRGCHTTGAGTAPQQLHSVSASATGGCVGCHSNNATGYYVDISLFGRHANLNLTGGQNNVTDDDCKTCHFASFPMRTGSANSSNTHYCQDCHTTSGSGPVKSTIIKDGLSHGSTDCKWCHVAGNQPAYKYHAIGPRGTATGANCLTCHYDANLPDEPFHAPGENHEADMNLCGDCHNQADNHAVTPDPNSGVPPSVLSLSVTTPVSSGTPSLVQATISDDYMRMAAARYQVTNATGVVIDWTNMTPSGGKNYEYVSASIDTSKLFGNYTVNVKGMASAPKSISSIPYYPFNGQWSGVSSRQFTVTMPKGYINGTIRTNSGINISGATVTTNTGVSTISDVNGKYSVNPEVGSYQLRVGKEPEFYINSSVNVPVTAFNTTTQDIILTAKPTGTISGTVRNK